MVVKRIDPHAPMGNTRPQLLPPAASPTHATLVTLTPHESDSARDRASEAQLRFSQAMNRYAGGLYAQRFVLVRTGEGSDPRRDLGWTRFVRQLELVVLPGDHVTLVTRHVDTLAQAIRGAIERTLAPTPTQERAHER